MAFELTAQIEKHLTNDRIIWLTTVTPSMRPAPRPVWFMWDGTAIIIYSQPTGAKLKHLAANDQVSLHFNCSPDGGDVVVISGRAEVLQGAPLPSDVPGILEKYQGWIQAMGYTLEWLNGYNTAIRVTPERSWAIPG